MSEGPSDSPAKAGQGWTDAEQIALLISLLNTRGGPDWKVFEPPAGRTKIACSRKWDRLKELAKQTGFGEDGTNKTTESGTPTKSTPKRKRAGASKDKDENGEDVAGTPSRIAKRTKNVKVEKQEPTDD